jgi:hypothetical protein
MPENITIAAFVLGGVMLLISIVGGKFKIFGAEVSAMAGPAGRIIAGVIGTVLISVGLYHSLYGLRPLPAEDSAQTSADPSSQMFANSQSMSTEALPKTYVLTKLTSIRPQEAKGEDRVYLRLDDSKASRIWQLKAGESVQVNLVATAGTSVSLYEKDGIMIDGDDDFLGAGILTGHGGKLNFEVPEKSKHRYMLSYEPES